MTTFTFLGGTYRTNADATIIERLDGKTWNRTYSARVCDAARYALPVWLPLLAPAGPPERIEKFRKNRKVN